jgi:hypothetical protein
MSDTKKHIGYKVEVGFDLDFPIWYKGFITYFNGEEIIITSSNRFERKEDAWKWISNALKEWELTK